MKRVDECDVEDRRALVEFRGKFAEWSSWLWSDEYHAIERQIARMIHGDMAYRILIEARRCTNGANAGAAQNGLLASFIDQSHVETQVLAIGKLTDRRLDVLSVRRLLDDVRAHCHLLTREIYVGHDGLPYEPRVGGGEGLLPAESDGARNLRSYVRHQEFDRLSGKSPGARNRLDCIQCSTFRGAEDSLKEVDAEGLRILRNKFIAHAANPGSRGSMKYSGPSHDLLEKITNAHRHILRALEMTCGILPRFEKVDRTPHPPLGFLNGLDKPYSFVSIPDLQKRWDELVAERNEWQRPAA